MKPRRSQTPVVPPPPQTSGWLQVPHDGKTPPQPSTIVPQFLPCAAQVVGVHPQRFGVPPPPQLSGGVQAPQLKRRAAAIGNACRTRLPRRRRWSACSRTRCSCPRHRRFRAACSYRNSGSRHTDWKSFRSSCLARRRSSACSRTRSRRRRRRTLVETHRCRTRASRHNRRRSCRSSCLCARQVVFTHIPGPHTFGTPPPPQTLVPVQSPQLSGPPHLSGITPQFLPSASHVVGVQPHTFCVGAAAARLREDAAAAFQRVCRSCRRRSRSFFPGGAGRANAAAHSRAAAVRRCPARYRCRNRASCRSRCRTDRSFSRPRRTSLGGSRKRSARRRRRTSRATDKCRTPRCRRTSRPEPCRSFFRALHSWSDSRRRRRPFPRRRRPPIRPIRSCRRCPCRHCYPPIRRSRSSRRCQRRRSSLLHSKRRSPPSRRGGSPTRRQLVERVRQRTAADQM